MGRAPRGLRRLGARLGCGTCCQLPFPDCLVCIAPCVEPSTGPNLIDVSSHPLAEFARSLGVVERKGPRWLALLLCIYLRVSCIKPVFLLTKLI